MDTTCAYCDNPNGYIYDENLGVFLCSETACLMAAEEEYENRLERLQTQT